MTFKRSQINTNILRWKWLKIVWDYIKHRWKLQSNIREVICVYNSVVTTSGMIQPLLSLSKILCWRDIYISNNNKDRDGKLVKGTDNSLKNAHMFQDVCILHISWSSSTITVNSPTHMVQYSALPYVLCWTGHVLKQPCIFLREK